MSVLSSVRILDFSTLLPGPYASMMLADMGADVLRVEAPDRPDMVRAMPPFDGSISAAQGYLNRSKRSIAINLKKDGAADIIKRLVHEYDVVLEQFRPGVMDRLGIGYGILAEENPRLIYCALTGYGQTGPLRDRAGHDNNYLSLAGVMSHCGSREEGPTPQGVQIADLAAGSLSAVIGILSAIVHRNETGEGQLVDVSMFDGSVALNAFAAAQWLGGGELPERESMGLNGGSQYGYYRTKDGGYLSVGSLEPKFWIGFCQAIERPDLVDRLTMPGDAMRPVIEEIRQVIASKTLAEWTAIFAEYDVCVEPVLSLEETFQHPHTLARGMRAEVPKPDGTHQSQAGAPIKFSKSPPVYKHIGVELGAHTDRVLQAAGYSPEAIAAFREGGVVA